MSPSTQPILVLGASGNVGAPLVELLHHAGHSVRAALTPDSLGRYRPAPGVAAVAFDFADQSTYGPALDGVARLFLLRPPAIADVGQLIHPFIDAARAAGVTQIVLLSILGADRNPLLPHRTIERHLEAGPADWTFLRAGFFMQNLSTTHRDEIRDRDEILIPAGAGRTSFIDARDIAAVAARCLTEEGHRGRAYDLTGAAALDYQQVAEALSAELGRPITYRRPSLPRFLGASLRGGRGRAMTLVMAGIYTTTRLGLAARVAPDAARLLGRPPTSLGQFIHDQRAAWLPGRPR